MGARSSSDFWHDLWVRQGRMRCKFCGKPIYCDNGGMGSGYYFHIEKTDGGNGLYCTPERKQGAMPFSFSTSQTTDVPGSTDREGETWRSSITYYINTYRSIAVSPGIDLETSVRLKLYADALERQISEIEQILEEAEKRLQCLPEVSVKEFRKPHEATLDRCLDVPFITDEVRAYHEARGRHDPTEA